MRELIYSVFITLISVNYGLETVENPNESGSLSDLNQNPCRICKGGTRLERLEKCTEMHYVTTGLVEKSVTGER